MRFKSKKQNKQTLMKTHNCKQTEHEAAKDLSAILISCQKTPTLRRTGFMFHQQLASTIKHGTPQKISTKENILKFAKHYKYLGYIFGKKPYA